MSTVTDRDATSVGLDQNGDRARLTLRSGLLRAQQVRPVDGWTRVALIANTALLLGGDRVRLDVRVGEHARLELFEVAGTVAYHGRGRSACWEVSASVAPGGQLIMNGEPFVVAEGSDVERELVMDVGTGASVRVRETVVLGRVGERGGRLRNRTMITVGGAEVLREDQQLDPELRTLPGLLGSERVIDTLTSIGSFAGAEPVDTVTGAEPVEAHRTATFALLDEAGQVERWVGSDLVRSPLRGWCR